jgi:16S rRNA (cytidine1402-2'-O)-methyltransferase
MGYLPHKSGQRRRKLDSLKEVPGTWVLYESPHRIERLLEELSLAYPRHTVAIARELTKKFEEHSAGTPTQLLERCRKRRLRGEIVLMVSPPAGVEPAEPERTHSERATAPDD